MTGERYKHLFLPKPTSTQGFTSTQRGGSKLLIPNRDRDKHSIYLQQRLQQTWSEFDQQQAVIHKERHGAYIEFESEPGFNLAIQSLENFPSNIRLLNVRKDDEGENQRVFATVYVPHNKRGYFLKKIQAYANEDTKKDKPKYATLINSISDIRNAVLKSFWRSDECKLIPGNNPEWIEVWLSSDQDEVINRFEILLRDFAIEVAEGSLKFPERSVKLIQANQDQLKQLIESSDDIAEYRGARKIASYFINELNNQAQSKHVQALLERTRFDSDTDVVVCILDRGVNNGHVLLQPILHSHDLHTVKPEWGTHDHDPNGHGTLMAGVIAYGDLLAILNDNSPIKIPHRLESAKILPPLPDQNPKKLWGYMTTQGISRAEIQGPKRKRIICMAVTATEDRDRGRPSSWSAKLDELASGYEDDIRRLIIVSGGNVDDSKNWRNYPEDNLTNEIHDPAQAWNALTIGAFTQKTQITDTTLSGYSPIAPAGGLSPYSTTSTTWSKGKWPIKPEVLFEGGNVARGPNESILNAEDLQLLSTYHDPQVAQFGQFGCTSAASAQAAWMAAQIQAQYPDAWPETIRALIVHTAEWTETMKEQFLPSTSKEDYRKLLQICGYGVPNLERALYCASNSLTLISQAKLQPFNKRDGQYVTNDMHLYNLPWPSEILSELSEAPVKMRLTLSYFIEPGPGEVGWDNRYRYPSHALRFAVNGPGESEDEFVKRINKQARDDEEHPGTTGPGDKWVIGKARDIGSIHSDIWEGMAVDLATSNKIVIYPAAGWWRERKHSDGGTNVVVIH